MNTGTPLPYLDLRPSLRDSSQLDRLAIEWLEWLYHGRGRSKRTINTYGVYLRLYFDWCRSKGVKPLAPSLEELEAFLVRPRLRQGKGKSGAPSTQRGNVTVLKGWFTWMHQRGHIPTNPTLELFGPKRPNTLPKPVPDKHWVTMWSSTLDDRMRLALGLGYFCGLRRLEMCELRGSQIKDETIVSFVRKGGGEDSLRWRQMVQIYVDLRPELIEPHADTFIELMQSARGQQRILWVDGQQFYKRMVKLCDKLGIPTYTPHQLRHSCATNLVKLGMRETMVAELLNHSSVDITRKYAQFNGADLDDWRRSVMRRDAT
jgi:site-specific recombinase XerD